MEKIKLVIANNDHVEFLTALMNDPDILKSLREVPTTAADWAEAIPLWTDDPDEEDYIVCDGDQPIGWLGVNELISEAKAVSLKMAAMLPEYQHKGIGTYAIKQLIENLQSRGFSKMVLYTDQDNFPAQNCYKKCGFSISGELTDTMSNGETVKRYIMELSLVKFQSERMMT